MGQNKSWFIFFEERWQNLRFCKLSVISTSKKNSKLIYDWIFKIIIAYYNLIFLISAVLSLVCVCVFFLFLLFCILFFVCFFLSLVLHFGVKDCRRMIFQKDHLRIWAIGGHELGSLNVRVHNSLTIYELWNSIIFLNFKNPPPPPSLWRFVYKNQYVTHPLHREYC